MRRNRSGPGEERTAAGYTVRLVLEGDLQDGPFLKEYSRVNARGAATVWPVGAGLGVRVNVPRARTRAEAVSRAKVQVQAAARNSGVAVRVMVAAADDEAGHPEDGVHWVDRGLSRRDEDLPAGGSGPDRAPCPDCRREAESAGRRNHYGRTECLACGPRFAHARGFPLSRDGYGLARFPPCGACEKEAETAGGRRFASQRVTCATCGPTLTLIHPSEPPTIRDAIGAAVRMLEAGRPVAINTPYGGIAVATPAGAGALRVAVGDEWRAFVVICPTVASAQRLAELGARESDLISSPSAPEVWAEPTPTGTELLRAASPFEPWMRVRMPDCILLLELSRRAGPLLGAGASRGGMLWPSGTGDSSALQGLPWLSDGLAADRPLPPARSYALHGRRVLLAHGRGSLPAAGPVSHDATVISVGGGTELSGAVTHAGTAYFTGSAGPAERADSAARLKALLSHAAALSPAAQSTRMDAVASTSPEGSPSRLVAEELAEDSGAMFVPVVPLRARVGAASAGATRAPPVLVLESEEDASGDATRWYTDRTGGELIEPSTARVLGGIAPYEVVESPGGRHDLLAALASLFARAGAPLGPSPAEDEPILRVLRSRAQRSTSAVALVDAVAAALGAVPRRAPVGSGLLELSKSLARPGDSRRFRMEAPLTKSRGSRQVDALRLLGELAHERQLAARRDGGVPSIETRAALGASFLRALLDGIAASCAAAKSRPQRVVVTGRWMASPPAAAALFGALERRGIRADLPSHGPVLDGALAYGAAQYAGTILT